MNGVILLSMKAVNRQNRQTKSTLRQRQAQATAKMITAAAKDLFLEQGYTATTIEAIAGRAEVAVSTVYAVFGSKRGILRSSRAAWHERSQIQQITFGDPGGVEPEERLEQLAQATYRQWQAGVEILIIYNGAAAADPEAAAELHGSFKGSPQSDGNFCLKI